MSDNAERRVTVLLTKRQYEELVQRAGIAPMGAYIKSELFKDRSVLEQGKVSEQGSVLRSVKYEHRESGDCPHRKRKGELCYKCDPKFGYPAIGA